MSYSNSIENLNEDIIDKLKLAIEIGRWENGDKLTPEQIESSMQAVMLWQAKNIGNKTGEPFLVTQEGKLPVGKGRMHKTDPMSQIDTIDVIIKP